MKTEITLIVLVGFAVIIFASWKNFEATSPNTVTANSFEECVALGSPVMESYPRQCRAGEKTFVENIGNELEKADLIRITTPRPNSTVGNPITITGEARGTWYFEASFPIEVLDANGNVLAQHYAMATEEWMTEEFVPFTTTITLNSIPTTSTGNIILRRDNPSGLPENDDFLIIPVKFAP